MNAPGDSPEKVKKDFLALCDQHERAVRQAIPLAEKIVALTAFLDNHAFIEAAKSLRPDNELIQRFRNQRKVSNRFLERATESLSTVEKAHSTALWGELSDALDLLKSARATLPLIAIVNEQEQTEAWLAKLNSIMADNDAPPPAAPTSNPGPETTPPPASPV